MNFPTVSVIIVNYNGKHYLSDCLYSLDSAKYPKDKLEIIVVDNGSTDGSVEFLNITFPSVKVIRNETNKGFAQPNNIAAKAAKGEYLALLNNDMVVAPDWLNEIVAPVIERTKLCVASKILNRDGSTLDFVGGTLNFYGIGFQDHFGEPTTNKYDTPKKLLFACGGAMLISRKVFLDVGGFDEDYFAYFEDVDLGWRLWVLGYEVEFAPKAVVYHHHHGTSSGFPEHKKQVLYERNALYTLIKNYNDENLAKILPVSLFLTVKRSLFKLGIDPANFEIEKTAPKEMPQTTPQRKLLTLIKLITAGDFKGIVIRIKDKFSPKASPAPLEPDKAVVNKTGVSNLIALDDIMVNFEQVFQKRNFIQTNRVRSDEDIFHLFNPFKSVGFGESYESIQGLLTKTFGIDKIFQSR